MFFGAVLPMFLLYVLFFSLPKVFGKILLMSGLVFLGCLLSSLGFFADVVVPLLFCLFLFSFSFFREIDQVVTGHTPHTHLCSFAFSCLCPAAFVCSPVLAVRPFFLAFCRGAILGPGRFWDSPGTLLRPFSRTRGGKGVFVCFFLLFLFSPSVVFCGSFHTH